MWTGTQPSIGRMKSIFRLFPSFWRLIAKPDQRWQPYFIEYAKSTTRKRDWITAVKNGTNYPLHESTRGFKDFDGVSFDGVGFDGDAFDGVGFDGDAFDGVSFDGASFEWEAFDGVTFDEEAFDGDLDAERDWH